MRNPHPPLRFFQLQLAWVDQDVEMFAAFRARLGWCTLNNGDDKIQRGGFFQNTTLFRLR